MFGKLSVYPLDAALLSGIILPCWAQSHFRQFCFLVQCQQALGTLSSFLTCNGMKRQKSLTAALRTQEISREEGTREKSWKKYRKEGRVGGTKVSSVKKIFFAFCVTTVPYCPLRKCHFALGRQLSEARLICLTAFTEMFCGHIQRSPGGVSLCFVCPTTPNHIAPKK